MIYSETIEKVYSNVVNQVIYSEEDPDYRRIDSQLRITEDGEVRILENEDQRIIE